MGAIDKVKNAGQKLEGDIKQKVGQAAGDRSTEMDGRKDQAAGSLKQAGENVKDAFR